jgi:hypothetical protein
MIHLLVKLIRVAIILSIIGKLTVIFSTQMNYCINELLLLKRSF